MNSLEALNEIKYNLKGVTNIYFTELCDTIETSLKALEIIKNKRVDVDVLLNCKTLEDFNGAMEYTHNCKDFNLTLEQFDLLKKRS